MKGRESLSEDLRAAVEAAVQLRPLVEAVIREMRKEPLSRALSSEALGLLAARAVAASAAWFGPLLREALEAPAAEYPRPEEVCTHEVTHMRTCVGCGTDLTPELDDEGEHP